MKFGLFYVLESPGQQQVFCWMRIGGLEDHTVRTSMKLFAEEVMPRFRDEDVVVPAALRDVMAAS